MRQNIRMTALTILAALGVSLSAPGVAHAGSAGRRNTALALGAVAVYGVVKKKPAIAGLAGGGAIYSYMKSREAARKERRPRYVRKVRYVKRGGRYYKNVYYVRR